MVTIALYNPLVVAEPPMALRMPLLCSISRVTIMIVRRTLRATEIEWCGMPNSFMAVEAWMMPTGREIWLMSVIPVAVSMT